MVGTGYRGPQTLDGRATTPRVTAGRPHRGRWLVAALVAAAAVMLAGCGSGPPTTEAPAPSSALPPPSSPVIARQADGMRQLGFMVGRWEGDGSGQFGPGPRTDFHQVEQVDLQLSGELMTVAGHGTVPGKPSAPSFSAFAVTTFDPASGTYRWEAFSQGSRVDTTLQVTPNGWTWGFAPRPGIDSRYTAAFTGDTWHETGETSTDGGRTWHPSLDMTLHRTV